MMHIVLVEPEIPQNAGNIARTCAATGAALHLVRPLGFSLEDRYLKRAGLDYWPLAQVMVHEDFPSLLKALPDAPRFFFTTKGGAPYTEFSYPDGAMLVFGKETRGLSEALLLRYPGQCARIPMRSEARSLNLSNAVAVALYEALRQQGFPGMQTLGALTGRAEEPLDF
jgi:tRNA (cytidine/uridine-2'-O-)-methyltransferase